MPKRYFSCDNFLLVLLRVKVESIAIGIHTMRCSYNENIACSSITSRTQKNTHTKKIIHKYILHKILQDSKKKTKYAKKTRQCKTQLEKKSTVVDHSVTSSREDEDCVGWIEKLIFEVNCSSFGFLYLLPNVICVCSAYAVSWVYVIYYICSVHIVNTGHMAHVILPVQFLSSISRANPLSHLHLKLPMVFLHFPLTQRLWNILHSLTSRRTTMNNLKSTKL